MKKIIYWTLFPFTGIMYLLLNLIAFLAAGGSECIDSFEGWALEYKRRGYKYLGSGCWSKRG